MTTANIFDLADTWNDGATTFTAIKMNVADTASAAASLLMDLQVGGVSQVQVTKDGAFTGPGSIGGFFRGITVKDAGGVSYGIGSGGGDTAFIQREQARIIGLSASGPRFERLLFTSNVALSPDLALRRDAADTLAQYRGANAQTFNIYNTYTDASNYERARMGWAGNAFELKPEAAGTGTVRVLHISGLPTSDPGPGILWNDAGTVKVGT